MGIRDSVIITGILIEIDRYNLNVTLTLDIFRRKQPVDINKQINID